MIVDDHEAVHFGLKWVLENMGLTNVQCSTTLDGLTELILEKLPALVILDVTFSHKESLEVVMQVMQQRPSTKFLIYTKSKGSLVVQKYLNAGVKGFVNKNTELEKLANGIEEVLKGRVFIDEFSANALYNSPARLEKLSALSKREFEVLMLLADSCSYKEIADQLCIAVNTVGTYKSRISEKLGVHNRREMQELIELYNLA